MGFKNKFIKRKWITTHCFYCEKEFKSVLSHKNAGVKTIDHIIPLVKGGKNNHENVVIACNWCNNQKHDMDLEEFYQHIENLKSTLAPSVLRHIDLNVIQKNIEFLLQSV